MNIVKKISELLDEGTEFLSKMSIKNGGKLFSGVFLAAAIRLRGVPTQSQGRDNFGLGTVIGGIGAAQQVLNLGGNVAGLEKTYKNLGSGNTLKDVNNVKKLLTGTNRIRTRGDNIAGNIGETFLGIKSDKTLQKERRDEARAYQKQQRDYERQMKKQQRNGYASSYDYNYPR